MYYELISQRTPYPPDTMDQYYYREHSDYHQCSTYSMYQYSVDLNYNAFCCIHQILSYTCSIVMNTASSVELPRTRLLTNVVCLYGRIHLVNHIY